MQPVCERTRTSDFYTPRGQVAVYELPGRDQDRRVARIGPIPVHEDVARLRRRDGYGNPAHEVNEGAISEVLRPVADAPWQREIRRPYADCNHHASYEAHTVRAAIAHADIATKRCAEPAARFGDYGCAELNGVDRGPLIFQTRPSSSSILRSSQATSTCHQRKPTRAEPGNMW